MGGVCSTTNKRSTNCKVPAGNNFTKPAPVPTEAGNTEVHMLICALDYKKTKNPLTCTMDGKNMEELARACGVHDLVCMYDEQCQVAAVKDKIREIASRMDEDHYFIFYYSGHGTNVDDKNGDEEDGQDEAFCFVDANGQVAYDTLLTDDDFNDVVTESMPKGARILILTDCCHSGTIADLGKPSWADFDVVSIAGCTDTQTSGDMGTGGIFTHSLLLGIEKLEADHDELYSVGLLYNTTLGFDDKVFHSAQDITLQYGPKSRSDTFAWPLVPMREYASPLTKARKHTNTMSYGAPGADDDDQGDLSSINPQQAAAFGLAPALLSKIKNNPTLDNVDLDDVKQIASSCNQQ